MDKLPIVEALLSEEEDEYGSLVPLNRHGEKAAEIIETLVAALEPFADHASLLEDADADDTILCGFDGKFLTACHLRAARAALTKAKS